MNHVEDATLAQVFGKGFHPIKVGTALSERDESPFEAEIYDGYDAGNRLMHTKCGEIVDVDGFCPKCKTNILQ